MNYLSGYGKKELYYRGHTMNPDVIFSLVSLTFLEIVLGIDNLVIISIIANRAQKGKRLIAMRLGLTAAWIMRLIFLAFAVKLSQLTHPVLVISDTPVSIRDLFMLTGGVFLIYKGVHELKETFKTSQSNSDEKQPASMLVILSQIMLIDLVFSIDSILTAIGLTKVYWIMATSITIAILMMIFASKPLHWIINRFPTLKTLALAFVLLIGAVLIADGLHIHIDRGYLYAAIIFSLLVEILNININSLKK